MLFRRLWRSHHGALYVRGFSVLTPIALIVSLVGSPTLAVMSPAEIYSTAEKWFQSLETGQHLVPTTRVTLLDEGYYHRC